MAQLRSSYSSQHWNVVVEVVGMSLSSSFEKSGDFFVLFIFSIW